MVEGEKEDLEEVVGSGGGVEAWSRGSKRTEIYREREVGAVVWR